MNKIMNNKRFHNALITILIFILLSILYIAIVLNKIYGTWSYEYIGYDDLKYTQKYVFKRNNHLENIVIRPDGTMDTYDLGKYKVGLFRITYKSPWKEGPKKYVFEYNIFKNTITNMTENDIPFVLKK